MIRYRFDVLKALKEKGYNSVRIRAEKVMGERQVQQIRVGEVANSVAVLDKLCKMLGCQPGDLLEYVPDDGATEDEKEIAYE